MKILILNFEYPPLGGGGGVATSDLAQELAKRHTVHVLTTWFTGLAYDEVQEGVYVHRVRVPGRTSLPTASLLSLICFAPAALWRGWRLCRRERFDVLNAQFVIPSGLPAAILARLFSVPFVLSFIGGDLYDPSKGVSPHRHWWLVLLIRLIARQAVACTAISSDTKKRAEELHGITRPITVTHLGLKATAVPLKSRRELNLPEHVPLFVSIGRLIPRKRYDLLISAWADIPRAQLLILGSGPLEHDLKERIESLGLADRVMMLGFVSETKKQQLLRAASAYISAAEHEGFGIVFLEAMEAGLPIVATDEGGQTDFLKPDINALLVPPGDARELARAANQLLLHSELSARMGRENRRRVQDFYLEKTAAQFETIFEDAVRHFTA